MRHMFHFVGFKSSKKDAKKVFYHKILKGIEGNKKAHRLVVDYKEIQML